MILNDVGRMAEKYWLEITNHFSFVRLDEYVVMPNHVHGILVINNILNGDISLNGGVETPNLGVSTTDVKKLYKCGGHNKQWKPGSLGVIINQYKRQCTIKIRKNLNPNFAWQTRFYDHIIRNDKSLNKIRQYIIDNPLKWELDRNNLENFPTP